MLLFIVWMLIVLSLDCSVFILGASLFLGVILGVISALIDIIGK